MEHAQSLEGVGNVNKSDVVAKTLTKREFPDLVRVYRDHRNSACGIRLLNQ